MDLKAFEEQILKTGFPLEDRIAEILKAAKWSVISNRYYVDDTEKAVREIDLVAYQITNVQHVDVYTTLIISCKKSESNAWALLARGINLKDPNINWQPVHTWSNDKALNYQLTIPDSPKRYHEYVSQTGAEEALATPEVEVFAFQEMSKSSGAPQNDRAIFTAVTSLMKAQAHEMHALPARKKKPSVYQFNLLSIVDTDLLRLKFRNGKCQATPLSHEHYIARYIIDSQEYVSRIRFLRADAMVEALSVYNHLHIANCKWFEEERNRFYESIVKDPKRIAILVPEFRDCCEWQIRSPFFGSPYPVPPRDSISLLWSDREELINVSGDFKKGGEKMLNANQNAIQKVRVALRDIYRYTGKFKFENDEFPF